MAAQNRFPPRKAPIGQFLCACHGRSVEDCPLPTTRSGLTLKSLGNSRSFLNFLNVRYLFEQLVICRANANFHNVFSSLPHGEEYRTETLLPSAQRSFAHTIPEVCGKQANPSTAPQSLIKLRLAVANRKSPTPKRDCATAARSP